MDHQAERWAAEQAILDHADRFAFMGQKWVPRGPGKPDEACAVYRTKVSRTQVNGASLAPLFEDRTFNFVRSTSEHIAAGQPAVVQTLVGKAIELEAEARSGGQHHSGPSWNDHQCQTQDEVEDFLRHAAKRVYYIPIPA